MADVKVRRLECLTRCPRIQYNALTDAVPVNPPHDCGCEVGYRKVGGSGARPLCPDNARLGNSSQEYKIALWARYGVRGDGHPTWAGCRKSQYCGSISQNRIFRAGCALSECPTTHPKPEIALPRCLLGAALQQRFETGQYVRLDLAGRAGPRLSVFQTPSGIAGETSWVLDDLKRVERQPRLEDFDRR